MGPRTLDPGDAAEVAAGLAARFRATYGRPPDGCFRAPGRVNLIGEHVDYNAGRCLPIALPHATYVAAAPRADDTVTVTSLQQGPPFRGSVDCLGPGAVTGWAAYAAGVAWAMREDGFAVSGFELLVDTRVPLGAGLSSSAALECAVALALAGLTGCDVDLAMRRRLAAACLRAETEVAGAPTGGMDQAVSLLARRDHALLLDFLDGSARQVPWRPARAGLRLLVVDTRVSHRLTDGSYGNRRAECEEATRLLGAGSLREVHDSPEEAGALRGIDDPRLRRRARHVLTEMSRVDLAVRQLEQEDWAGLGSTLTASHESLRGDFEVSCPELDAVVVAALDAGALGARMTGAGFGGSALALVPEHRLPSVVGAVGEAFSARGWEEPLFLDASAGEGAQRV